MERVAVAQNVLKENDRIAAELRAGFLARRTVCLNLISSPGAGKTSLLERTLGALAGGPWRVAVLTGDIQTDRDAARLRGLGSRRCRSRPAARAISTRRWSGRR